MKMFKISEPCHEDWSKMTPEEKGRFCSKCSKTVHDFTKKSDKEISDTINNTQGGVCGHFKKSQLNREIILDNPVSKNKPMMLGVLAVLGGISYITIPGGSEFEKGKVVQQQQYYMEGEVVDAYSKKALSYVNVVVYKGDDIYRAVLTDVNGKFKIPVQEHELTELRLEFTFKHYETAVYIPKEYKDEVVIEMFEQEMIKGEVMYFESSLNPEPLESPQEVEFDESLLLGDTIEIEIGEVEVEGGVIECELPRTEASTEEIGKSKVIEVFIEDLNIEYTTLGLPEEIEVVPVKEEEKVLELCGKVKVEDKFEEPELIDKQLKVYPNPSSDFVWVEFIEPGKQIVEMYDINDKRVYRKRVNDANHQIVFCSLKCVKIKSIKF